MGGAPGCGSLRWAAMIVACLMMVLNQVGAVPSTVIETVTCISNILTPPPGPLNLTMGYTYQLSTGTYTMSSQFNVSGSNAICLIGTGANETFVSITGSNMRHFSLFTNGSLGLQALTLLGDIANTAGGIEILSVDTPGTSTPKLGAANVTFRSCKGIPTSQRNYTGGALHLDVSSYSIATLNDCSFINNVGTGAGAVQTVGGSTMPQPLTFKGLTQFKNNSGIYSGGIVCLEASRITLEVSWGSCAV